MEPWLEELSEDWNSEPRSSSPSVSQSLRNSTGSQISGTSQSRIPHLAQSLRSNKAGSFLNPRSTRGIARAQSNRVLGERSASNLNVRNRSLSYNPHDTRPSPAVPRQASSAFSDSQSSVQHHAAHKLEDDDEVPEWKQRLVNGEDATSDGLDLFAPSRLEGIFKQNAHSDGAEESLKSARPQDHKPWTNLDLSHFPGSNDVSQSVRAPYSRKPTMAILEEEDEEQQDQRSDGTFNAVSSDLVRDGSMRGLVKQRVTDLEKSRSDTNGQDDSSPLQDPRWRTFSGRQEIEAEYISPVTASRQNSIRNQALQSSLTRALQNASQKPSSEQKGRIDRPLSPSSDRDISYDRFGSESISPLPEDQMADMTSQSLPDDLSMGTQDLASSYLTGRPKRALSANTNPRAARPVEHSFRRSISTLRKELRSSPPPCSLVGDDSVVHYEASALPEPVVKGSPPSSTKEPQTSSSGRSPLKLFGNRDTYTNSRLLRVLNQYEQDGSSIEEAELPHDANDSFDASDLKMGQFGQGQLDGFNFEKEVKHAPLVHEASSHREKLFDTNHVPSSTLEGEKGTLVFEKRTAGEDNVRSGAPASLQSHRTSKRRRTLTHEQSHQDDNDQTTITGHCSESTLAGKKRKDAKPGEEGKDASPETLASRTVLRPRAGSRQASLNDLQPVSVSSTGANDNEPVGDLTEALAAELESFTKNVTQNHKDLRKPSYATKDYMAEANKVMEFIRARGKPKPSLPGIEEPVEVSELDPDAILDIEIEDSTKDSFSRPPSREGLPRVCADRRNAQHDPRIENHLQKYREPEDLELLMSMSVAGTLGPIDNVTAELAAKVPVPPDEQAPQRQASSPPGMRILNDDQNVKKRKYSGSVADTQKSDATSGSSTRETFPTHSSSSSGQKGMITSGTVSIPDQVGKMTFDHEKKIWVKKKIASKVSPTHRNRSGLILHRVGSEADPFESIPDLSIDEKHEEAVEHHPRNALQDQPGAAGRLPLEQIGEVSEPNTMDSPDTTGSFPNTPQHVSQKEPKVAIAFEIEPMVQTRARPEQTSDDGRPRSQCSEVSKHEERLAQGLMSQETEDSMIARKQPRVVTISFSSPVASEMPSRRQVAATNSDIDEDDPSLLPLDDDDSVTEISPDRRQPCQENEPPSVASKSKIRTGHVVGNPVRHEQYRAMILNRRPVSRIEEHEESRGYEAGLSLIRITDDNALTPAPTRSEALAKASKKEHSLLCLTPLSDFTLHQADKLNHPEESYVATRTNPKGLLQAHGAHHLGLDELVRAITDAQPGELFWENLRQLELKDCKLTTLRSLDEYCTALETLNVSNNQISQLDGLPSALRSLSVSMNRLNDLTSWSHLHNLQRVQVSSNHLESLDCFSSLVHLRYLDVSRNKISRIDGVLKLSGLVVLKLGGNQLSRVKFNEGDLSQLEHLDLSNNSISSVHGLRHLSELTGLDLSLNYLSRIDVDNGKNLSCLSDLNLSHNNLEEIDLISFPVVRKVNLDNNKLRKIHALSAAETLHALSVREQTASVDLVNQILSTPNECAFISLSSNTIRDDAVVLPEQPQYNLRQLEMSNCGLGKLPEQFGSFFPNCRTLDLSLNGISDLSPLLGMVKLRDMSIAGNRIKRLRRTCLTLSRLTGLTKLDMRDNPLTVGFYDPTQPKSRPDDSKCERGTLREPLPLLSVRPRCPEQDQKWLSRLDETTVLRRRTIELLLAGNCQRLVEFDGANFDPNEILRSSSVWQSLTKKGVLMRSPDVEAVDNHDAANQSVTIDSRTPRGHERRVQLPSTNEVGRTGRGGKVLSTMAEVY